MSWFRGEYAKEARNIKEIMLLRKPVAFHGYSPLTLNALRNGFSMKLQYTCTKLAVFLLMMMTVASGPASAASAREIDIEVNETLSRFTREVGGADAYLQVAKGILVFPTVYKAGIGIGGEYGEGALLIAGRPVDYYSTAAASFGFQLGAQAKSIIILFMQDEALRKFRESEGWKVGVDGSVALADVGVGKELSSQTLQNPIVGFVFGQKGLMYNLTLEGSKFTKLKK
jgi:lipid-binding SYLF domain-containing protein